MNLEELVQLLRSGQPLARTNKDPFELDSDDSRKIFAFYSCNRQLWEKSKQIRIDEIDNVLHALDDDLPEIAQKKIKKVRKKPVWHLIRVEIHRFAGLHQHLDQNSETPKELVFELDHDGVLLDGFNGAGKTALLSAITWCLTGKALRSQDMPQIVEEPMNLRYVQEHQDRQDSATSKSGFQIPLIVPIPTKEDLKILNGSPKLDTSVKLTFRCKDLEDIRVVSRGLEVRGKKFTETITGLDELDLPPLAIEVGTLMPAIASHMRFNEKSDLAQAVSELTGLRPLEQLDERSRRMIDRLQNVETKNTTKLRDECLGRFNSQFQTFEDTWNQNLDLGESPEILSPNITSDERNCQSTLAETRSRLSETQESMRSDLDQFLGKRFDVFNQQKLGQLSQAINGATEQLKTDALRRIPFIETLMQLNEVSDGDVESSKALIQDVLKRAGVLEQRLKNAAASARWILYTRVARWHKENHPEEEINNCPVCGTRLDSTMLDPLVDESVKSALDYCLKNDADAAKTAVEWEEDESAAFLSRLPSSMRKFVDISLPKTLDSALYKGYVKELLSQKAFKGLLEPLQERAQKLWDAVAKDHPRQESSIHVESELPTLVASGQLQRRVGSIGQALTLRTQLNGAENYIHSILADYIGAVSPEDRQEENPTHTSVTSDSAKTEEPEIWQKPLMAQLNTVRRGVKNIAPAVTLINQLDSLETTRKEWAEQEERLTSLKRAAVAMQPFLTFRELVHERVENLITILNDDTSAWLDKIYSSHYNGGPDYGGIEPSDGSKFAVSAKFDNMLAPAHQVMNASLLKACVWAFLFSLWGHVKKQSGILSCMLLDDPQTHFDSNNCINLARTISIMLSRGMHPIITSNDYRFLVLVRNELRLTSTGTKHTLTTWRINPISASRATANLGLWTDAIDKKREQWQKDENDVSKAQDFVTCVRVDIEERLLNFLMGDPLVFDKQTLSGILDRLRTAKKYGELPFSEPPFEKLFTEATLRRGASFYDTISKAHHRSSELTPRDAAIVACAYDRIRSLLNSCEDSYTRFRNRPQNTINDRKAAPMPARPVAMQLQNVQLPLLGKIAARTDINLLASDDEQHQFSLDTLGPVVFYAVRGPSLGLIALPGQVVIASLEHEAADGDPVVALYEDRTYVRRFHQDKKFPSQVALVPDRSGTENVPPVIISPKESTRIMPIVGVLYDSLKMPAKDEALAIETSAILSRELVAAEVAEDSAYPVINSGDLVLLEECVQLTPEKLETLNERIVAITVRDGSDSFSYLKRLGQDLDGGRYICESIGSIGTTLCVAINESTARGKEPWLERLWRVHGFIRMASRR